MLFQTGDVFRCSSKLALIIDTTLLKQSIFNLQTYIRLQKMYLEESVHVLLSFKREIFEGSTSRPLQPHIVTSIIFESLSEGLTTGL